MSEEKLIYNYHPQTAEYLGSSVAAVDPVNSSRYLIPLNSSEEAPPEPQENMAIIMGEDGWTYISDYRGVRVDAQDSSKRYAIITELGITPENIQFVPVALENEDPVRVSKSASLEEQVAAILRWVLTLENVPEDLKAIALHANK